MIQPFPWPLDGQGRPSLEALLNALEDGLLYKLPVYGPREDCIQREEHEMKLWITGSYAGRNLRLWKCLHCEAVEVRDVSLDHNIGGSRLARRPLNRLLGWYTGRRPLRRTYS